MEAYSSAQRYSDSKPVPITSSPAAYGAQYPPQPQQMMANPVMAPGVAPGMAPGVAMVQPTAIIVNQVSPSYGVIAHTSSPFSTVCPSCKNQITTTAVQTFNCGTCLLCCWTGYVLFICLQLCRGKDICCYDAVHRCPVCGQTVAIYNSC